MVVESNRTKKWAAPVSFLAILTLLTVAALFAWWCAVSGLDLLAQRIWMGSEVFHETPFDKAKWASYESYRGQNVRKRMYHDLASRHLFTGMTRREVVRLLGKPEHVSEGVFHYYLGPDAAGMDTNELLVEFDKANRVRNVTWHAT